MNLLFRLIMLAKRWLFHLGSGARRLRARLVGRRGPIQYVPAEFRNAVDADIINVPQARWVAGPLRSRDDELPPFLDPQRDMDEARVVRMKEVRDDAAW